MKRRFYLSIVAISLLALVLSSCTDFFGGGLDNPDYYSTASASDESSVPPSTENLITVSGKFSCQGAVPLQVAQIIQAADSGVYNSLENNGRSAVPAYEINSTTQYFVKATGGGRTVNADVDSENRTFSIALAMGVEWTIVAGLKQGETVLMQSEPLVKTFSASEASFNQTFEIKPSSSGTGSVEVELHAGDKVASVTVFCDVDPAVSASGTTLPFSENKVIISLGHVPGGLYNVTFKFTDTDGNSFYMQQAINVFNNMKTNYWLGGAGLGVISGGVLTVSNSIMSTAARKLFYVGATGVKDSNGNFATADDENDGSAYSPLASLKEAINRVQNAYAGAVDYKIYLYSDQNLASGSYVVNSDTIGTLSIEGKQSTASTISGNTSGSVFNVTTSKPVTFKNVKITGGNAAYGGGLYVGSSADVTLDEGVSVTGNTSGIGGNQVYVDGKLTVDDSISIPTGQFNGNAKMDWKFSDSSEFVSSKQAFVTVKTSWAKSAVSYVNLIVNEGEALPKLSTTNPPSTHTAVGLSGFERVGYDLNGFYTEENSGGTQYFDSTGNSTKNCDFTGRKMLYAGWAISGEHGELLTGGTTKKNLQNGYSYVVSDDASYSGASSGMQVNGTVTISIEEGCTLSSVGADGNNANGQTSGTGGYAGIYLESTSTLNVYGYGTLNATGGKGGNAASGASNKNDAWMQRESRFKGNGRGGKGGSGGGGAGGGGAGIGTNGAAGGKGGSGGDGVYKEDFNNHNESLPANDVGTEGNGKDGSSSSDCGNIFKQNTIVIVAQGGAGGSFGASGTVLTDTSQCGEGQATNYRVGDSGSGFSSNYASGAGGAGGGGGAGGNGADIGTGGAGGGGGGGGAGGAINGVSSGDRKFIGGHGGGGGLPSGGAGQEDIEQSRTTASGGSGGAAGTGGVVATVGTL